MPLLSARVAFRALHPSFSEYDGLQMGLLSSHNIRIVQHSGVVSTLIDSASARIRLAECPPGGLSMAVVLGLSGERRE